MNRYLARSTGPTNPSILVLFNRDHSSAANQFHKTSRSDDFTRKTNAKRERALTKYGLSGLNLIWPGRASDPSHADYTHKNPVSIKQMYGESDLSALPIFQGGFINFGYWPNPMHDSKNITKDERIASSKEMYRVVGNLAKILPEHSMLDVGCGLGYGDAFLSEQYNPKLVVGVDISPDQIARAKLHQIQGIKNGKLRLTIGEAESMPFPDSTFDRIISVEAAQHFQGMNAFSKEVARILKPDGNLVMTSFFPTNKDGVQALNAIVPDYHIHGSQHTIEEVQKQLLEFMGNVEVKSIGENVWNGFSKWLDQLGYSHQWSKIWPALYDKGLVDYVVYHATQPKKESHLENRIS